MNVGRGDTSNDCCTARPVLKEERNLDCNNCICKAEKTTQNFQVICRVNKMFLQEHFARKKGNILLFQVRGGKALLDLHILLEKHLFSLSNMCKLKIF